VDKYLPGGPDAAEKISAQTFADSEKKEIRLLLSVAPGNEAIEQKLEQNGFQQDPDVLDTWFSSALWPHSTLGWPEQTAELKYYYPTSVLVTSRDIITLWVARMVITGLYNCKREPFHHVYIHPKILDGFGEGMSKSKGNGVDPLDIIERYGTDALRFVMVHLATETQDSRLPVANVCPHCGTLNPMKKEHLAMRTRKVTCPGDPKNGIKCGKAFRPGGPWPAPDPELPTAKQASEKFEMGRNFANKLWNAARFLMMKLEEYRPEAFKIEQLPIEDRWILSRLATVSNEITAALEGYHFSEAARIIYDFTWSEFCDWYVEMSKGRLNDPAARPLAQRMLVGVLDAILRLVQPIMPFVAESIWQHLNEAAFERGLPNPEPAAESVVIAVWPTFPAAWTDPATQQQMARMQDLVRFIREVRNRYSINPKTPLDVFVRSRPEIAAELYPLGRFVMQLAGVGNLDVRAEPAWPAQSASHVTADLECRVSLQGLIDPAKEREKLQKQLAEKRKYLHSAQGKLNNDAFRKNADPDVVQQQVQMVVDLETQIKALEGNLGDLTGA
jgi:valyl-tRNA synthetase